MKRVMVCLLVLAVVMAGSVTALAEDGGYYEAVQDGRRAAREDVNSTSQFVGGLGLGVLYVLYAAITPGEYPGAYRMMSIRDKSDEYKRAYVESYSNEWKRLRSNNALLGWATWIVLLVAVANSY